MQDRQNYISMRETAQVDQFGDKVREEDARGRVRLLLLFKKVLLALL